MRQKPRNSLCAAIALSFMLGSAAPAISAPVFVPKAPEVRSDVIQVQDRRWRGDRREFRRDLRDFRRDRFERRGDAVYWRGHRGYRYHRPGYRNYNGWWFPPAAFALGAIIGGAVANQPRAVPISEAHVRWCYDRYRSYRASDNTFQPYNGPRRSCISPYS